MAEAPASMRVVLTTAERLIYSPHNYWFAMVTDLAGAAALFFFVIRHRSTSVPRRTRSASASRPVAR